MTLNTVLFWIWMLCGFPMGIYRSKFRKIVYQDDHWSINIKPYFIKELHGLLGNLYPENQVYLKARNFYRSYLVIYIIFSILYFCTK